MFILKQCERISIVTNEDDILENTKNHYILSNEKLYDTVNFECMTGEGKRKLFANMQTEYEENKEDAEKEFERISKRFTDSSITVITEEYTEKPVESEKKIETQERPELFGQGFEQLLVKVLAEQSADVMFEAAKPKFEKHIFETYGALPQVHEIKTPTAVNKIEGALHEKFDQVLNLVNLDIPIYLSGEAGTGKNVICKQVADSLGLEFYFTNAITQEYQLKGFTDANGNYQATQFYEAFTKGGLFFLDEMDGSIPEALIILNSAIANRYFDFPAPIGKVEAHENFRIISAGNTVGTGADIEYTGRFQLDASSLDRFALIEIDYSPTIEKAVTNGNETLCDFARQFRKIVKKSSIRCLFTYRSLERINKMEELFDLPEVLKMSLTKGLEQDDLKIIVKGFKDAKMSNKYTEAIKTLSA